MKTNQPILCDFIHNYRTGEFKDDYIFCSQSLSPSGCSVPPVRPLPLMACPGGSPCLPGSRIDCKKPPERSRGYRENSLSVAWKLTRFLLEIQVNKSRWAQICPSSTSYWNISHSKRATQHLVVTGKVATPLIRKEILGQQGELIAAFLSPFLITTMAELLPHNRKVPSRFRADQQTVVAAVSLWIL